jgi:hypothetical protein
MGHLIKEEDVDILKAFLVREARMFPFSTCAKEQQHVDKMLNDILSRSLPQGADHVIIRSITNMGMVESALVLTCGLWSSERNILINLPPSPNGGISFAYTNEGDKKWH